MFRQDTLIITYDETPASRRRAKKGVDYRAKASATASTARCACRSAHGIDIRKGLQYECIACAPASTPATR